jgi:pilus assembly protein Flp/PilA
MIKLMKNFLRGDDGATAIEYGLIAAGISVAIAVIAFAVGDNLVSTFEAIRDSLAPRGS